MKELDITYNEIRLMRELLVEEARSEFTSIGIECMKLVEMRLQTVLMAGMKKGHLESERRNFAK